MRLVLGHWAFRGAAVMSGALAVEAGMQFARSVALTRLLDATEFGLASAMVTVLTLVDMGTFVAADRYLVHANDGGSRQALAAGHTLTLFRGLLCALLLLAMAVPTSRLLGVSNQTADFCWLACIPVIKGFENLRLEQLQREHCFWRWAAACSATNIIGASVSAMAAFVLRDHRAVLWGLGAQAVSLVAFTHLFSGVAYRISVVWAPVSRALRFGLPIMVNGLALAALGQMDRLVVGAFLGVAALGRYGLATMIFYVPTALAMRVMVSVLQPRLSSAWHASPLWAFPVMFRQINLGLAAFAAVVAATVTVIGNPLLMSVFGANYSVGDRFFAIFGLAIFVRLAKTGANFGGLAMGRTMDLMWSNLPMAFALIVTVLGLHEMPVFTMAAVGSLVGEIIGAVCAFVLLRRELGLPGKPAYAPFLVAAWLPIGGAAWMFLDHPALLLRVAAIGLAACVVGVSVFVGSRSGAQEMVK